MMVARSWPDGCRLDPLQDTSTENAVELVESGPAASPTKVKRRLSMSFDPPSTPSSIRVVVDRAGGFGAAVSGTWQKRSG